MARGGGGVGPFGDSSLLILTSLSDGPKHGYALIKDIERFSTVALGPGTLYGAIARLEEKGLVEALPEEARRRPFRITALGLEVLEQQVSAVERVASTGRTRLRLRGA
jgi:DNA-binding PadR family transcriptional regulator